MNVILKVILAVYKFFVGDLVILIGTVLTMVILALINSVGALASLREGSGGTHPDRWRAGDACGDPWP